MSRHAPFPAASERIGGVCERELEGLVAKRVDGRYRPGERGWVKIKIKNRDYWRYEM